MAEFYSASAWSLCEDCAPQAGSGPPVGLLTIRFLFAYSFFAAADRRVLGFFASPVRKKLCLVLTDPKSIIGVRMSIAQSLLPEFNEEMANTRKVLERVPDEKWNWKPHEKSGTAGWLAGHVGTIPEWLTMTLNTESLDYAP